MPGRKYLIIIAIGTLLAVVFSASAFAATPFAKKAPTEKETVIWRLTQGQIVDPGQTVDTKEGTLTSGFTIQALAKSKAKLVPVGKFELSFTAFSPQKEMPGQKPGVWYVQGKWILANEKVFKNPNRARYVPELIEGVFKAELDFNPATDPARFTGLALLPMGPADGRWSRGEGTLTLNKNFNGELFLELERWPAQK
ncbi:MAG: hypothetical protein FOGNACKC_02057 [Anaerolineae bacterium]|nr:hypothetical protein [Anaerolineae bacterium]